MNVLGLFGFGTNPGACLLREGELVAFAEEERFTRLKGSHGLFPGRSIEYCLRQGELELGDVDRLAFPWDTAKYPYRILGSLAKQYIKYRRRAGSGGSGGATLFTVVSSLLKYTPGRLREEIQLGLRAQGLTGEVPPIEYVPHHLCHSYSAYFCSPFDEAIVLTLDGSGEEVCTQIAVARGERLDVKDSIPLPHSLGWFYAAFTAYFGFTPYRGEGKLMGLAALGDERAGDNPWPERLSRILHVENGSYEVDPTFTRFGGHSYAERFTDALAEFITSFDSRLAPIARGAVSSNGNRYLEEHYVDLAWGVQSQLERAACAVAERAAREYGIRNLCVAGGVGLNCKMNGTLLANTPFERIFVQPASHDAGSALGAAMAVSQAGGDIVRNSLTHARFGPAWSTGEIRTTIEACKLSAQLCEDIAARVADELAAGRIVGWFQGRMELGPRALGARSILASPLLPGVQDRLNREVKSREPWRPFCPSILDEEKEHYFEHAASSPFMTTAFDVRPDMREEMGSAQHVDGSSRPQTVTAGASPLLHRLISEFRDRSGLPFVINTSFNGAGEPIICSPIEALRCFFSTGLDGLAIGDYFLTKS